MTKLFAIDAKTKEVIVSESPKGSKSIHFIERIARKDNEGLYEAVLKLTEMANDPDFDLKEFKVIDKACQELYHTYRENN